MTGILTMLAAVAVLALAGLQTPADAGDCTGLVVGVQPPTQDNRGLGNGFLAVRSGPGSKFGQIGERYAGDEVALWERRGSWYQVACMSGPCTDPLWGAPHPRGWVSARHIDAGGVCP